MRKNKPKINSVYFFISYFYIAYIIHRNNDIRKEKEEVKLRFLVFSKKHILYGALLLLILVISFFLLLRILVNDSVPTLQMDPIYQGKTNQPYVALTINVDWGEDIIPGMLEVLEEKNVKATFYITGRFATKFPDIIKEIVIYGHEIGNHGFSHPHPDRISLEENKKEIQKTHDILQKFTEEEIFLFAPPYGERGPNCLKAAQELGYKTILWTADTIDWQEPPPSVDTLVNRVTGEKLTSGTIILMHPKPHTLKALPIIIDKIQEKGYKVKKVSEMI